MARQVTDHVGNAQLAEVVNQVASQYRTVGEMVYAVLREAILSGAFAPGEWLRQESLAETIGVSRIPVRTALLQLEADGLVTFHRHRGARVRSLSRAQLDEIYEVRALLEKYALRQAMTNMDPERLSSLDAMARQLDSEPDGAHLVELRKAFYQELYGAANNDLLMELIEELRARVGRYLLSFRANLHGKSEHVRLLQYIADKDMTAAQEWLDVHLQSVRRSVQSLADESE